MALKRCFAWHPQLDVLCKCTVLSQVFLPISGSDSCIHLWKSCSKLLKVSTKHFHSKSRSRCWCTQTMRFFFPWYEFLSYAKLSYSFRTPICAVKTPLFMLVGGYFSQFSLPYEVISIINQPLLLVIMYGRTALYNIWIQDSQTKLCSVIIWWWLYIFFVVKFIISVSAWIPTPP